MILPSRSTRRLRGTFLTRLHPHRSETGSVILWLLVALFVAGGAALWWRQSKSANKPIDYRTGKITKGEIIQSVSASGQVTPLVTVQVGSQVSGIIEKLYVDFNSTVTNGQLLAQLEPSSLKATLAQSEGDLANANASLSLAELNAKRATELLSQKLIPQQEFDKAHADLQLAKAQVQIRQARLLKDQVDLSRTTIFSPIDGVVIQRAIDVGQTVAASFNAPVLFQIANDLRKMQIHAMVSEADIGGVEVGQDVTFNVDAFPLRTFQGRVEQVRFAATTNQNVVTYATVISVPNDELKLRPGMTATVSIINSRQRDVVRIPNTALRFRPPEGALVKSNTPSATAAVEGAGVDPAASTPSGGGEGSPGREGVRRRSSGGEGGGGGFGRREGGGGPGGGGRGSGMASSRRTIYKLEPVEGAGSDKGFQLVPVEVRLGITDGTFTEVKDGLKEGDEIAIGVVGAAGAPTAPAGQQNPFGGPGMRR